MDMFPFTTERAKTAVDQVGQTVLRMTYFLSSRAMLRQLRCYSELEIPSCFASVRGSASEKNRNRMKGHHSKTLGEELHVSWTRMIWYWLPRSTTFTPNVE